MSRAIVASVGALGGAAAFGAGPAAPVGAQAVPAGHEAAEEIVVTARRIGIPVWRVRGPKGMIVLVGTIDGVAKDTRWDPGALTATLRKADRVMFPSTVSISASPFAMIGYYQKWRKQATLPKGQTLANYLPPAQFQRLVALKNRGILKPGFERKHPLHLSMTLRGIAKGKRGYGPGAGQYVTQAVKKHKIKMVPIKAIQAKTVAGDFFSTPPKAYLPCLLDSVTLVEAGPGAIKARSDAWAARRVPDVLASPADKVEASCFPPAFESSKPSNLSGQMKGLLSQPQTTVAVFNLRSLAEPGGVLDDLAAAGFNISGPPWKR